MSRAWLGRLLLVLNEGKKKRKTRAQQTSRHPIWIGLDWISCNKVRDPRESQDKPDSHAATQLASQPYGPSRLVSLQAESEFGC